LCLGKAHVMNQTVQLSMTIDYTDFFEVLTATFTVYKSWGNFSSFTVLANMDGTGATS
jgi:hypothetical protein